MASQETPEWEFSRNSDSSTSRVALRPHYGDLLRQLQCHYDFIVYLAYSLWRKLLAWEGCGKTPQVGARMHKATVDPFYAEATLASLGALGDLRMVIGPRLSPQQGGGAAPSARLLARSRRSARRGNPRETACIESQSSETVERASVISGLEKGEENNPSAELGLLPRRYFECRIPVQMRPSLNLDHWGRIPNEPPRYILTTNGGLCASVVVNRECQRKSGEDFKTFIKAAVLNNQLDVVHLLLNTFQLQLKEVGGECMWELGGLECLQFEDRMGDMTALILQYAAQTEQEIHFQILEYALVNASKYNFLKVAHLILEDHSLNLAESVIYYTDGALHPAIREGHFDMVQLLLHHKANTSETSMSDLDLDGGGARNAIQQAAVCGHVDIVQLLVEEYGVEVDDTALYLAADAAHTRVVEFLIQKGANLNFVFESR